MWIAVGSGRRFVRGRRAHVRDRFRGAELPGAGNRPGALVCVDDLQRERIPGYLLEADLAEVWLRLRNQRASW